MAYEKMLNEIYAAVYLKYLWKEYKPHFIKSESPDWINETMDFGLEVSQALLPHDGQEEDFIEKYSPFFVFYVIIFDEVRWRYENTYSCISW